MPSLFPGMAPYLEDPAFWPDFHARFINYWCEAIADRLPDSYEARLDELPHEFVEEVRQTRIEILHRPNRTLVAVLEMLSPANKTGDGFLEYRAKRRAVLSQKVHLVELDLLLGGNRLTQARPLPAGDYFAFLSRAESHTSCEVYSWSVRQPLPTIPVPLRAPDADRLIDLGEVFRTTFERGRYARSLSYGQPPRGPLSPSDAKWALTVAAVDAAGTQGE